MTTISIHEIEGAEPAICPRCEKLVDRSMMVSGICPACKKDCESAHRRKMSSNCESRGQERRGFIANGSFDDSGKIIPVEPVADMEMESENDHDNSGTSAIDALLKQKALIERCWLLVKDYEKEHGDPVMVERCGWLVLGFTTLAGAKTQDALVELLRVQLNPSGNPRKAHTAKQRVNKCIKFLQKALPELPPLPNQRTRDARKRFKATRIKKQNELNLKHTGPPPPYGKEYLGPQVR